MINRSCVRLHICLTALLMALCYAGISQAAEPATGQPSVRPPQGLPRLGGYADRSGGGKIPAEARSVVDLYSPDVVGPVGRIGIQGKIRYLALPPSTEWDVALRSGRTGANYTTFTMQVSVESVISVDGAFVTLKPSEISPGYATLHVGTPKDTGMEWTSLHHHVELRPYMGQLMGELAIVTLCTNTESGHWSVSLGDRLVAHDLPLVPDSKKPHRLLTVKTGTGGAWVSGVASSDENPVFEDSNHNGVRDSFEKKILGTTLSSNAPRETKERLFKVWKERFYVEPSDYALTTQPGAGETDWENIPAEFFLETPTFDQPAYTDSRTVPGLPTAIIHR